MARGWESKQIEEQRDVKGTDSPKGKPLSPEQRARAQQRQGLELSLAGVRRQLGSQLPPARREMLERAAADLEQRLAELG